MTRAKSMWSKIALILVFAALGLLPFGTMSGAGEHRCVKHCREHYENKLAECSDLHHPEHRHCERWAREREKECLGKCYEEYPR